jgi:membrane-associated phospholipid phosphatase
MDESRRLPVPVDRPPHSTRSRAVAAAVVGFCRRRPIRAAFLVLLAVSVVALAFPGLDLAVAGLFHVPGRGFPVERMAGPMLLRDAGMGVTRLVVIGLVLVLFAKLLLPFLAREIPTRPFLFLAASLALGPGLLVNAVLKELWGRPRPREILDFGGAFDFVTAGIPGGACVSNCSFPSGEASSAAWLFALVFVLPPAWRKSAAIAAAAWTLAISVNRIAFGGHFLSDVLIAWALVAIVVLWCRKVFLIGLSDASIAAVGRFLGRLGDRALDAVDRRIPGSHEVPAGRRRNPVA